MRLFRVVGLVALALALAPCGALTQTAPKAATRPDAGPLQKGIEVGDLDRTADPCTDFYAFANGAWRAANPIPAGRQNWSRRIAAREKNREQLKAILRELAATADRPRGSVEQQLGDHFAACMDEPAVDALGMAPLAPLLAEIDSVKDVAGVERSIRRLHELAIAVPFALSGGSDYHAPGMTIVNIAASGLGLPDRDYYLNAEPRFAEARQRYRDHVAAVLRLSGMNSGAAGKAAEQILGLETRLAEASLPPAAANDPAATAHMTSFAVLAAGRFDWKKYFGDAGLPEADVNVAEPAFLKRVDLELEATPVDVWKAYLRWHLLESASPWLSKPFVEESFAFKDRYLGGAKEMTPRATRCLESTEALLGDPLGRKYVERYFPPEAKRQVQEIARGTLEVLREEVRGVGWMNAATRGEALAKLATYEVKVGYPDTWTDESSVVIRRDSLWANIAAARRFGVDLDRRRVGRRASRENWLLPASSPDAYIDVQLNLMALPAGFLQPPAFDPAATDAANYGAIGIGIAHDLTHAIDALGADFDATGQPRNWWTESDRQGFEKVGQCVVDQYEGYAIEPGVHHEGKRVLGEAIGDLAGVRVAYLALERSMEHHKVPVIDGFSAEQQFFISWGQFRGAEESLELQRKLVKGDPHPVAKYRVIGPLSNSLELQQAFGCKDGAPMVRPPAERCAVW